MTNDRLRRLTARKQRERGYGSNEVKLALGNGVDAAIWGSISITAFAYCRLARPLDAHQAWGVASVAMLHVVCRVSAAAGPIWEHLTSFMPARRVYVMPCPRGPCNMHKSESFNVKCVYLADTSRLIVFWSFVAIRKEFLCPFLCRVHFSFRAWYVLELQNSRYSDFIN